MKSANTTIKLESKKTYNFIEITEKVKEFVGKSKIKNGLVNIQVMHTSSAVVMNECDEPLLVEDIIEHLERSAPRTVDYKHDDFDVRTVNLCKDECKNGHSHCKALFLPATITLNLINGVLQLGTYQKLFFLELDRGRSRKVQVQIIGD